MKRYQRDNYKDRPLSNEYQGFDPDFYPETAKADKLDSIANAIGCRKRNNGEDCDSFRLAVLKTLEGAEKKSLMKFLKTSVLDRLLR